MLKILRTLTLFVIIIVSGAVIALDDLAEQELYQIEVIFFEHTDPKRFDIEEWPKFVGSLDQKNAISLKSELLVKVEDSQKLLKDEVNILKKTKETRVIAYVAWRQSLTANVKSTPVYIEAGKDDKEVEAVIAVRPIKNQFDVIIDSIYHDQAEVREFRITRDIKVKKKEMFYVDHPIMGMMVIVSPVAAAIS